MTLVNIVTSTRISREITTCVSFDTDGCIEWPIYFFKHKYNVLPYFRGFKLQHSRSFAPSQFGRLPELFNSFPIGGGSRPSLSTTFSSRFIHYWLCRLITPSGISSRYYLLPKLPLIDQLIKTSHLQLSDDSDIEGHPNVDKKSLIRYDSTPSTTII